MVFSNNLLFGAAAATSGAAPFDTTLIGNSIWLNGSDNYLTKTPSSAGNRTRWTLAWWFQLNAVATDMTFFSANDGSNDFFIRMDANSSSSITIVDDNASMNMNTTAMQRDVGWYHCIISYDSNQTIASDRVRIYINGEQQSLTAGSAAEPSSGGETYWNNAQANEIGRRSRTTSSYTKAYMTQICFLNADSIQNGDVSVSDFLDTFTLGTNGSQFVPKKDSEIAALASTAGGNSFCLDFADSSGTDAVNLGNDISSNNNDFTPNNMSSANQSSNTPSKVYATFNPLAQVGTSTGTLSEGNTKLALASDNGVTATKTLPSSGMWYWEIDWSSGANGMYPGIALQSAIGNTASSPHVRSDTFVWLAGDSTGRAYNGSSVVSYVGSATSTGRIAVAFDADNTAMYFGTVSGSTITWLASGDPTSGSSKTGAAPFTLPTDETLYIYHSTGNASTAQYLFDEDDWNGSTNRPADAKSLNSANLTAPDYQGIDYFDATVYEGNGKGQRVGDFVPFTDSETVANSTIFNDDDSAYLTRTYVTATAATTFTFACWFKPGSSTSDQYIISTGSTNATEGYIAINHSTGGGQIWIADPNDGSGFGIKTNATFTDSSQWYHLCVGVDSTAGSGSRVKVEVNGVEQTVATLGGTTEPSSSQSMNLNEANAFNIGRRIRTSGDYFDGYLANVYFIDGEKKQASDFGQLDTSTNRWVSKAYSGSYGNNGFKLAFGTASTGNGNTNGVGTDTSGEGHNWTEQGFTTSDQVIDSPSQNFATIDPVISNGATPVTLSDGNLTGVRSSSGLQQAYSSFSGFRLQENTGIYFAEVLMGSDTSNFSIGVLSGDPPSSTNRDLGADDNTYAYLTDGRKANNGTYTSYGATYTAGDVLGIEIDTDTGSINFHKNGSDQGEAFTGVAGPYNFAFASESGGGPGTFNFGQQIVLGGASTTLNAAAGGRFKHTPPTGAKALNQDNLDDTASKLTAWAWIKNRDAVDNHSLFDRVRGVTKLKNIIAGDNTAPAAESTDANSVQRFLQRGVQLGSSSAINTANNSYVLWQWLVGDSATTGTVLSNGSDIDATVITADAGHFSVGTYSGTGSSSNFLHGLGGKPEFVAIYCRNEDTQPISTCSEYYSGSDYYMYLSYADGESNSGGTGLWPSDRTATEVPVGTNGTVNASGDTYGFIAFRSIPGVCKVGKYTGNGDNNGAYVNLGFKPRWVMVKGLAGSRNWNILDTARNPINIASPSVLMPNRNDTDTAGQIGAFDILSDGFKPRDTAANSNASTEKYLYIAMADLGGNGTLPPIYGR